MSYDRQGKVFKNFPRTSHNSPGVAVLENDEGINERRDGEMMRKE